MALIVRTAKGALISHNYEALVEYNASPEHQSTTPGSPSIHREWPGFPESMGEAPIPPTQNKNNNNNNKNDKGILMTERDKS